MTPSALTPLRGVAAARSSEEEASPPGRLGGRGFAAREMTTVSVNWGPYCGFPYQKSPTIWSLRVRPWFLETPK